MIGAARYRDRTDAGRALALALEGRVHRGNPIVLGLPRGGIPVAYEIADVIPAPLEVFLVRKLGLPAQPELALGAIATGGVCVLNEPLIAQARVPRAVINRVLAAELRELERRAGSYRSQVEPALLREHPVILVDDGLATGCTMRAAIAALRQLGNRHLTIAVPVGAREACAELTPLVDALVCPLQPADFRAVGWWYENFAQITDAEVNYSLDRARHRHPDLAVSQFTASR